LTATLFHRNPIRVTHFRKVYVCSGKRSYPPSEVVKGLNHRIKHIQLIQKMSYYFSVFKFSVDKFSIQHPFDSKDTMCKFPFGRDHALHLKFLRVELIIQTHILNDRWSDRF
jgi:hypothetical protein